MRTDRAFRFLIMSFILWVVVEFQFESGIPLDLSYHFRNGTQLYGTLGAIDLIIVILLQLIVSHWLSQRKSPWWGYSGFVLLGGLIVGGLWQSVAGWTISIVLLSLGEVISLSEIMTNLGTLPKGDQSGQYFILFGMAQGFASFLAYGLGGFLYQTFHAKVLFSLCLPVALASGWFFRRARIQSMADQDHQRAIQELNA